MIAVQVWALPRTGPAVPLPDLGDYTIAPMAFGPGAVTLNYPADGRNFTVLHDIAEDDVDLEIEIRTDGTSVTALRALLFTADGDEATEGATWQFTGHFLPVLLSDAVLPYALGGVDADNDGLDETGETWYTARTPGYIWADLMAAAQTRGALLDISYSSFTATHDSNGQAWTRNATVRWSPGRDYLSILTDLEERGFCEAEVTPSRELRLYNPDTRGVDRTVGPTPVVLERGRDQLDAPRKHTVRDAGTSILGAGKGVFHEETNAGALARRGRRIERYRSYNDVADLGALTALTQVEAVILGDGASSQSHELVLTDSNPLPGRDFGLADWVFSSTPSGLRRRRVALYSLSRAGDDVRVSVTLDDLIFTRDAKLTRQLAALQAGTVAVGTPTAPPMTPTEPAKAPAIPTGLVATSLVYTEPGPTPITAASVSASWAEVTTHADGTPVASTPSYRVRYRYLTGDAALNATQPYPPKWLVTADGYVWLPGGETAAAPLLFSGLSPDQQIELQVASVIQLDPEQQPWEVDEHQRAFRRTEMQSAWSAGVQLVTANDLTPPPAPSAPLVTNGVGDMLRITWDGLDAVGADMRASAPDLDHVEVHLSTASNFTPDASTYRDTLFAAGAIVITDQLLYGVTYYARLVAIDLAGNRSDPSAQHSGTPALIADGDLAGMSIAKLTAGVLTADLTLSARIKTANTGARIEMDAASFRQYDSAGTLRTRFVAADGSALVTGQLQSALTGQRWAMMPDGTLRLYPSTGTNYSAIFNVSGQLILGGQLDSSGRSGYLRVLATGIAAQFGVPGDSVTAQLSVGSGNVDLTSPINGLRVDKRYAHPTGGLRCNVLLFNDTNGDDMAGTVLQHREWNSSAFALAAPGRNTNILFANDNSRGIKLVYNDGNFCDIQCGNVYAPNVVAPSGVSVKQNIADVPFSVLDVVRGAKSKRWQYRPEMMHKAPPDTRGPGKVRRRKRDAAPDTGSAEDFELVDLPDLTAPPIPTPDRVGPMADDIRVIEPSLVHVDENGDLSLSYGDLIGVLWQAVEQLADKVDELTDKFADINELPGRGPKGAKKQ